MIKTYSIQTGMGQIMNGTLDFLSGDEIDNMNLIGYSGKLDGVKISREEYLNSLDKGEFKVEQTKYDNGDFSESFLIIRVTKIEEMV